MGKFIGLEDGVSDEAGALPTALNLVDPSTKAVAGRVTNSDAISMITNDTSSDPGAYSPDGLTLYTASKGVIALPSGGFVWRPPVNANGYLQPPVGVKRRCRP